MINTNFTHHLIYKNSFMTDKLRQFFKYKIRETQFFYNQKDKYFDLIEQYLDSRIDSNSFRAKFLSMTQENKKNHEILEKNVKQLSDFFIDSNSDGFGYFIEKILDFSESSTMPEDIFRDSIVKVFFEMKKRYP